MVGQVRTSDSRTPRITSRESSRNNDLIQKGPVATVKPGMNISSLSLLDRTMHVTPQVARMLAGFLVREVTRDVMAASALEMLSDSLSKKTEFYERLEQKQANQAENKKGFSFLDKETYEALPVTSGLDKSEHPIPGHPELPVEEAAEIKILSKVDPCIWICCYGQTWSNRNSLV